MYLYHDKPILKLVRFNEFNQCIYYINIIIDLNLGLKPHCITFYQTDYIEKCIIIMHVSFVESLCNNMHVYSEQAHFLSPLTWALLGVKSLSFLQ